MSDVDQSTLRNLLLRGMHSDDFALLAGHLQPFEADQGKILFEKDSPSESAWFLENGIGSLIAISAEGHRAESGLFGRDGFAPVAVALGSDRSSYQGIVQVAGDGFSLSAPALANAIAHSPAFQRLLLRFTQALSTQTAYTALSNAIHPIEERLARWLLMCHDRVDGNELVLTHEFLSIMLAVRRPSVTTSLHVLEANGFIKSERGRLTIRNRAGLEEFARDCYGPPEREYERLIGPFR